MLAASYWSLLAPAVELSKTSEYWNTSEVLTLVPVCGGFFLGALFVYLADLVLDSLGVTNPTISLGSILHIDKQLDRYHYQLSHLHIGFKYY